VGYILELKDYYKNLGMLFDDFMDNLGIKEKYNDKYCYFVYTNDNKYVIMFTKHARNSVRNIKIHIKNLINDKYSAIISFTDTRGGYKFSIGIDITQLFNIRTKEKLTNRSVIVDVNTGIGKYTVNNMFNKHIRNNVTPLDLS